LLLVIWCCWAVAAKVAVTQADILAEHQQGITISIRGRLSLSRRSRDQVRSATKIFRSDMNGREVRRPNVSSRGWTLYYV
jgi:hypothetical protein